MNNSDEFKIEPSDQLERFLDGLMSEQEANEFRQTIDPKVLEKEEALQSNLDDSLKRMFAFKPLDAEAIAVQAAEAQAPVDGEVTLKNPIQSRPQSTSRPNWIKLAIAASLLLAAGLVAWFVDGTGANQVTAIFVPKALTEIHTETVARGFDPYYFCKNDQRFADTFEARQGKPLALAELPEGSRMVGLSYPGGISGDTTAMLCEVDGKQVMVFVDVSGNDNLEIALKDNDPSLNVFVEEKNGLVFCEVTPHDAPEMIQHFRFIE